MSDEQRAVMFGPCSAPGDEVYLRVDEDGTVRVDQKDELADQDPFERSVNHENCFFTNHISEGQTFRCLYLPIPPKRPKKCPY